MSNINKQKIWIISKNKDIRTDLTNLIDEEISEIKEYTVSDLGLYLLDPRPIEVKKKLIGCEITYIRSFFQRFKTKLLHKFGYKSLEKIDYTNFFSESFVSGNILTNVSLQDKQLNDFLYRLDSLLKPYDLVISKLSKIDISKVLDIKGICEGLGKNRTSLNLQNSITEKINYIKQNLLSDVGIILKKAYISEGLFELSGFNFYKYNSQNSHNLVCFKQNNISKAIIVDSDNNILFQIEDIKLINFLNLFDYSINKNKNLEQSLYESLNGKILPTKLFFTKNIEINYTKGNIPKTYQNFFNSYDIGDNKKESVIKTLNNSQFGISFSYIPISGKNKLHTNISVIHDLNALDPIKNRFPDLFNKLNKELSLSSVGKYYLLDYIKGSR
jgi:hypothetical protein